MQMPRLEKVEGGGNSYKVAELLNPRRHYPTCDFACCASSYVTRGYLFSTHRWSNTAQSVLKPYSRLIVAENVNVDKPEDERVRWSSLLQE
jgi:hypothetical protein